MEEGFWRGITAAEYRGAPAMLTASTAVFGVFHLLFLLVPLRYEGGAVNLVGGPIFMGGIWLFVTLRSRSVVPSTWRTSS